MFILRLGIHRWATIDREWLDSVFQEFKNDRGFAWRLVQEPPFDGLIMNYPADSAEMGKSGDPQAAAPLAVFGPDGRVHSLKNPAEIEYFKELLSKLQIDLLLKRSLNRGDDTDGSSKISLSDPRQVMLRTWPPSALLCNDPERVHLAAILMEQKCNVAELAARSGQAIAQCDFFVQIMHRAGLVEHYPADTSSSVAMHRGGPSPIRPHRQISVHNVFTRIRRHLGRWAS